MRRFRFVIGLSMGLSAALAVPHAVQAQLLGISITIAPPELPVYEQPAIPAPGYIWTPGYWAYGPDGYFWVPGTWVEPPSVGLLWTPGYWGWRDGVYAWNGGYWGQHIGFYGGVNYGFGYGGVGYEGGYWRGGVFSYNTTVNNFGGVSVTNVYNKTVINNNVNITRTSFNGGNGGITAQPTPQEQAVAQEHHVAPVAAQTQQQHLASTNRAFLASENHGRPAIAATSKPGEFTGKGVVAAREAGSVPAPAGAKPLPTPAAVPGARPAAAATPAAKPLENRALENKQVPAQEHATATPGAPPKPPGAQGRPLTPGPKPAAAAPKPAVVAAAPKPPQRPAAPPAARPAPRQVAAAHPAPRPAPHPAPRPPARPKAPPHPEPHH